MESIITRRCKVVADGTLARLYGDIATIHDRLRRYVPREVIGWLSGMQQELEAYSQRMAAMCFAAIQSRLQQAGFDISGAESLRDASVDESRRWVLTGSKVSPG
jgi:hypothetical protein